MERRSYRPWLHRYAVVTALATLVLICFGGLVTSHEAGMAVPDWPNTFGYNLFFFPVSRWVGGIFYEHTHRLVAAGVGLLTLILAFWLWRSESRRWLRRLGVAAVLGIVLQGVLGGLRVVLLKDQIGVVHATLAQLFLVLVSAVALFTSRWWTASASRPIPVADTGGLRWLLLGTTTLVLLQLVLGATMRHRHAGLAIPDFPTAYGRFWPDAGPEAVARYNRDRPEVRAVNPITAIDIHLQMAHRATALLILGAVGASALVAVSRLGRRHVLSKGAWAWVALVLIQAFLGAATVWTGKSADVATAHVAVGSLTLALGGLLTIAGFRLLEARGVSTAVAATAPQRVPGWMPERRASAASGGGGA